MVKTSADEWQPIETAPRDGKVIWLGDQISIRLGFWLDGWKDNALAEQGDSRRDLLFEPTHWQHIPSPPPKIESPPQWIGDMPARKRSFHARRGYWDARLKEDTRFPNEMAGELVITSAIEDAEKYAFKKGVEEAATLIESNLLAPMIDRGGFGSEAFGVFKDDAESVIRQIATHVDECFNNIAALIRKLAFVPTEGNES